MADEETAAPAEESTLDIAAAVTEIGSGLFDRQTEPPDDSEKEPADDPMGQGGDADDKPAEEKLAEPPAGRKPPSSWTKDLHDHYLKAPKELQDYIDLREKQMLEGLGSYKDAATFGKTIRDIVTPHRDLLQQQGVDEVKAVSWLLNAHRQLSTAPEGERRALLGRIAKNYGLDIEAPAGTNGAAPPADRALQDRLDRLESTFAARDRAAVEEARSVVASEVDKFASDPAHAYFDEVSDHIARLIKADPGLSLADAYEQAVWANPVTREKEMARVKTDHEKKLRENARLDALPKIKASAANVRTRDTTRAPTDPLGTMEDTMKSTLAEIKQRVH